VFMATLIGGGLGYVVGGWLGIPTIGLWLGMFGGLYVGLKSDA